MDDCKAPAWYVVNTYSGYEKNVKATIEKHVDNRNMHHLIHEISIPVDKKTQVTEGKSKEVEEKRFPGYILVKMVMTDDAWHVVRGIRGVTGFLGTENEPQALPEYEVKKLGVDIREIVVDYEKGDSVTIVSGPFENIPATVTDIDLTLKKVFVNVIFAGQETEVELDLEAVAPL